jgi:hypothetical protein
MSYVVRKTFSSQFILFSSCKTLSYVKNCRLCGRHPVEGHHLDIRLYENVKSQIIFSFRHKRKFESCKESWCCFSKKNCITSFALLLADTKINWLVQEGTKSTEQSDVREADILLPVQVIVHFTPSLTWPHETASGHKSEPNSCMYYYICNQFPQNFMSNRFPFILVHKVFGYI